MPLARMVPFLSSTFQIDPMPEASWIGSINRS